MICALALVLSPFVYVQANKFIYASKVRHFLLDEQGYKPEEIKSVTGVWGIKLPPFFVVVVFADEPEVEYIYFAHNKLMQFEHRISDEGKKRGITEISPSKLKHYVPIE